MSAELIEALAQLARRIEAGECSDFGEQFNSAKDALVARTAPIHQAIVDAALARAGAVSIITTTKLTYAINFAQNELGLLPPIARVGAAK